MLYKKPRNIQFSYHALNSDKEPVNLNFSFDETKNYPENLRLFTLLLLDATREVQAAIDELEP